VYLDNPISLRDLHEDAGKVMYALTCIDTK